MSQTFDFDYINEENLINEIDRNDNLLNHVEQDIIALEHFQALHNDGLLREHHQGQVHAIAQRYVSFSPSMESLAISIEKKNTIGAIIGIGVLAAAVAGLITFIMMVVAFVIKLFTGGGSKSSSYSGSTKINTGMPVITITPRGGRRSIFDDEFNRNMQESLSRLSSFTGSNGIASMSTAMLMGYSEEFKNKPKELYDRIKPKEDYNTWHKGMSVAYVQMSILRKWCMFTGLPDNIIKVSNVSDLTKRVSALAINNWFPKDIIQAFSASDTSMFKKIPELLTSRSNITSFTNRLDRHLTEVIRFDNRISAAMNSPTHFATAAASIQEFKSTSDKLKATAAEMYEDTLGIASAVNAVSWFRAIDQSYVKDYNSSVEFNKSRMSEGVENISRKVTKDKGKDYLNNVEAYFKKCMAIDNDLEANTEKWNKLMSEFGKLVPTTISAFLRAYVQYAKMFVVMGRIMRAWNKFSDSIESDHKKLIELAK